MLVSDLKKYVNDLIESVEQTKVGSEYALRLKFVEDYQDVLQVDKELISALSKILAEFWSEIFNGLSPSTWLADKLIWESNIGISPWLEFQSKIAVDCGKARVEYSNRQSLEKESVNCLEPPSFSKDFHHEIFYKEIAGLYTAAGNSQLELTGLINLIQTVGRGLDYVEEKEEGDKTYPLASLEKKVSQLSLNSRVIPQVKGLISRFAALFYLFHRDCTPQQQALLFSLIQYRFQTTDEERNTETVIIKCLQELSRACQEFLLKNEMLIDVEVLSDLREYKIYLPQTRSNFIQALRKSYALCGFAEQPDSKNEAERLRNTVHLLSKNFTARHTASLAIIDFAEEIWPAFLFYNIKVQRLLWLATYICGLEYYIKTRKEETISSPMFAYSQKSKCRAAEEKIKVLHGEPCKLGFFQEKFNQQVIQQGRLGRITAYFENQKVELGLL